MDNPRHNTNDIYVNIYRYVIATIPRPQKISQNTVVVRNPSPIANNLEFGTVTETEASNFHTDMALMGAKGGFCIKNPTKKQTTSYVLAAAVARPRVEK
jgi:hypothetical protein